MFILGTIISDYKIIDTLGQPGGYGRAYRVINVNDSSEAALKECTGQTSEDLARFEGENNILFTLHPHDYIIQPLSKVGLENNTKYYLMELADENLEDFLNKNYNLGTDEKMELFIKVCEGIEHAHSNNIVHRDLWWNNVLIITKAGVPVPKLADFGRSRDFSAPQITLSLPLNWGLPDISQPELYFKYWDNPSPQNYFVGDIYALGVLLYYSLGVNTLPYVHYLFPHASRFLKKIGVQLDYMNESDRQQLYKDWLKTIDYNYLNRLRYLPSSSYSTEFIKKVDPIIDKMSNPDFSLRYQSVKELVLDLKGI